MERIPQNSPVVPEAELGSDPERGELKEALDRATELAHKTITELHKRRPDGSQSGDC